MTFTKIYLKHSREKHHRWILATDNLDRRSNYDLFPLTHIRKYIFKFCRNENLSYLDITRNVIEPFNTVIHCCNVE